MPETARTITAADLLPLKEYEQQRKTLKANLIPMKKLRRVEVGPFATFYFENYATMWLQVMEMLRIEKGGDEQVPGELAAYNPLIPQGSERRWHAPHQRAADPGRHRRDGVTRNRRRNDQGDAHRV